MEPIGAGAPDPDESPGTSSSESPLSRGNDQCEESRRRLRLLDRRFILSDSATSLFVWTALVVVASILRNGLAGWDFYRLYPFLIDEWDRPHDPFYANILNNLLAKAVDAFGREPFGLGWMTIQFGVTVCALATLLILLRRNLSSPAQFLVALALVLSTGWAAVLWREIGRYDAWSLIGVSLVVLGARRYLVVVGAATMALASPEQSLAAAILLLGFSIFPVGRALWRRGLTLLGVSLTVLMVVYFWFLLAGNGDTTRIGGILSHLVNGSQSTPSGSSDSTFTADLLSRMETLVETGYLHVWSVFGALVIALALMLLARTRSRFAPAMTLYVVVAPLLVGTAFGLDMTRDAVLVGAPLLLSLSLWIAKGFSSAVEPQNVRQVSTVVLVVLILLPSGYFFHGFEDAWRFSWEHLQLGLRGELSGLDYRLR